MSLLFPSIHPSIYSADLLNTLTDLYHMSGILLIETRHYTHALLFEVVLKKYCIITYCSILVHVHVYPKS